MTNATATVQTPPGRGGIAVIALTGDDCEAVLGRVFRPMKSHATAPADAVQLGRLVDEGGDVLDEAVVARSASGAIEINIHGGPVVARAVMRRLAEAGATVAEASPAATESFQLAHPRWSNPVIGEEMLDALPAAASPFVLAVITQQWSAGLSQLARSDAPSAEALRAAAGRLELTARLLDPPEVVLVGPPNVGKSALANELVGRAVSIVHDTAGTTRDWVRAMALFDGVPVWLTDTAGLFDPPAEADTHGIDAESVARARRRAEQADLVLLLSAGEPTPTPDWLHAKKLLHVAAKCDLYQERGGAPGFAKASPGEPVPPRKDPLRSLAGQEPGEPVGSSGACRMAVSSTTGEGLDELRSAILFALGLADIDPAAPAAFTQRQADCLLAAAEALDAGDTDTSEKALRALLMGNADCGVRIVE